MDKDFLFSYWAKREKTIDDFQLEFVWVQSQREAKREGRSDKIADIQSIRLN